MEVVEGWGPGIESLVLKKRSAYRMAKNCTTVLFKSSNADDDNYIDTVKRATKVFYKSIVIVL